jgi:hypothetical protein
MSRHSNHLGGQVVVYVYSNSPLLDAPEMLDLFKKMKIKNNVVFLRQFDEPQVQVDVALHFSIYDAIVTADLVYAAWGFRTRSYPIRTLGMASTSPRAEWAIPVLNALRDAKDKQSLKHFSADVTVFIGDVKNPSLGNAGGTNTVLTKLLEQ